ncbi:ATP-binding protein [Bradyrhizobium sp. WYCCWR 12699]|uniref:ATP-binding protein n=1 Tax=Bradyrhizobium sp. WYCCWR 12699 TaxID=3064203 RepID=UPI0028A456D2|nr:ATP-binding protein [Bradyrhizobium sp. WYCCWR 12699]MDT4737250.1 ATP-binding protein [Bradyrhizobium sp. WYCCWR 12699]
MPTTLVLVEGESYRVGQIGGFFRIPVGYTQLYAVCSQVGADAAPPTAVGDLALERDLAKDESLAGYRWMTIVLFGESTGGLFERGVGQYPTVGDEVHFVTAADLAVIYGRSHSTTGITVGTVSSASGISATLDLNRFVSRHCAIVGSTGAGKSNLVSVILEAVSLSQFPSARVLVIDPHGEYSKVSPGRSRVFRVSPADGEHDLVVPYWALPFDELLAITFGAMSPTNEAVVRDMVQEMKRTSAKLLANPPPAEAITADTPIPFSIRKLWFELDDFERQTFKTEAGQRVLTKVEEQGDPEKLISNTYPLHGPGAKEPFKNPAPRGIGRQLELARSRLTDSRYAFLFNPKGGYAPDLAGKVAADIDGLVASWVGHDKPLSIIDVSELPSDVATDVVGLLLRIVYDTLFWASSLAVSGKSQPLLLVVDEAHRFLPEGGSSSCQRILTRIAKEGRKYGVGLTVVTQRPSEIDTTIISQCGTMIALRTTNPSDRSRVAAAFPDDLGGLVDLLPSLRTGEGLFVGEAMFVPSRVRVWLTQAPEGGADPNVRTAWANDPRPDPKQYAQALRNWRHQLKG